MCEGLRIVDKELGEEGRSLARSPYCKCLVDKLPSPPQRLWIELTLLLNHQGEE